MNVIAALLIGMAGGFAFGWLVGKYVWQKYVRGRR